MPTDHDPLEIHRVSLLDQPLTLYIIEQLDEVAPGKIDPMFRYKTPHKSHAIHVIGECNGRTVRSLVYPVRIETSAFAPEFVNAPLHEAWADLPLVIL